MKIVFLDESYSRALLVKGWFSKKATVVVKKHGVWVHEDTGAELVCTVHSEPPSKFMANAEAGQRQLERLAASEESWSGSPPGLPKAQCIKDV